MEEGAVGEHIKGPERERRGDKNSASLSFLLSGYFFCP